MVISNGLERKFNEGTSKGYESLDIENIFPEYREKIIALLNDLGATNDEVADPIVQKAIMNGNDEVVDFEKYATSRRLRSNVLKAANDDNYTDVA
ncbi:hypothetical protein A9Q91_01830 [Candidatus Gracilibacteria bacterium 28_42_T64]|nr:hypothetical protein A9Q91_01830 [Candidatus Gracilibacteria bacterium 28_42_T64]